MSITKLPKIIGMKKGGGGGGKTPVEADNTLRSKTIARVIDIISEGEIKGFVKGAQSVFLDEIPLTNPDGSANFEGFSWSYRNGMPDQEYMSGFPQVEQESAVGVELVAGRRIYRTIHTADIDAVVLKLQIQALSFTDLKNGNMGPSSVELRLEYRNYNGNWVTARNIVINGKCTAPYQAAYRINLPKGGHPWDFGFTRITADSDKSNLQNKTYFASFTAVVDAKLTYPDSAYVGLTVDSEYFGTDIPSRGYEIDGIICSIPKNYDPYTRKYTGIWDGSFKRDWTNNPAWVMYDILTNPRYGLGREIQTRNVDKFGLYAIGQYCDEIIDDGLGGREPRFTFNGVINSRSDAYTVLSQLAGAFRGMVYFGMGQIICTQDSPADAKRLYTEANVLDGMFNYEGTALKARHSVVLVTWNNPELGYKADIEVVEDPEMIRQYGWRPLDLTAFGCTSRGQAYRIGKWTLNTEKYETEIVSFTAGMDSAELRPGDIIKIADPSYQGARHGGRLLAVTPMSVTIDDAIPFSSSENYVISLLLPDNTVVDRKIVNPGLETKLITFTEALDVNKLPLVGSVWIISASNIEPRLFRVLSVQENKAHQFSVTALFHDYQKYDRVEKDLILEPPATTLLPTGAIKPPTNLVITEGLYLAGSAVRSQAIIGWTAAADARVAFYEIEWTQETYPTWTRAGSTTGLFWTFQDTQPQRYSFRVRATDALGRSSAWSTTSQYLLGMFVPPADVANFRIEVFGDNAVLSWMPIQDLDLSRYELRYAATIDGSDTWDSAQVLIESIPKDASSITVGARIGTYFIKAVDLVAVYSVNAAWLRNTTSMSSIQANVVERFIQETAWLGEKDGTVLHAGVTVPQLTLEFDQVNNRYFSSGYYYFDPPKNNVFDLGGVYACTLNGHVGAHGYSPSDDFFDQGNFFYYDDFFNRIADRWVAIIEVRTTVEDPSTDSGFFYTDFFDNDFFENNDWWTSTVGWSDWAPLIASFDYTARAFQFRLHLTSESAFVTPLVISAWVEIDMPDRIESMPDVQVVSRPGGYRIDFNPYFMNVPAIVALIQEAQEGDWWRLQEKDNSGFSLELYNVYNQHIARKVDIIARGYGYLGGFTNRI